MYTESLLKGHKQDILLQNIHLYSWGVLCGVSRLVFFHVDLNAFMQAVTVYHIAALSLLTSTGIAVSFVMKYADNIVKVLGSAMSMFLAKGTSTLLFGTSPSSQFLASLLAAACAILMYNNELSQIWCEDAKKFARFPLSHKPRRHLCYTSLSKSCMSKKQRRRVTQFLI